MEYKVTKQRIWCTGHQDKETNETIIYFHIRGKLSDGTEAHYKFKGELV